VELLLGSADHVPDFGARFDKVFAVNVFMFWDAAAHFRFSER
jgi:hypothetical protein